VKEKRDYCKDPNNPRWKTNEKNKQLKIQNDNSHEHNAQSTNQDEKKHKNQNYNGDVSNSERMENTQQTLKKKRKYNKNPNHPRWNKKMKLKNKYSCVENNDEDSDCSYDPKKIRRKLNKKRK
jgi:hypothetical protein